MPEDTKKPKRRRRNFAAALKDAENYCTIGLNFMEAQEPLTEFGKGKIAGFKEILARLRGDNGRN